MVQHNNGRRLGVLVGLVVALTVMLGVCSVWAVGSWVLPKHAGMASLGAARATAEPPPCVVADAAAPPVVTPQPCPTVASAPPQTPADKTDKLADKTDKPADKADKPADKADKPADKKPRFLRGAGTKSGARPGAAAAEGSTAAATADPTPTPVEPPRPPAPEPVKTAKPKNPNDEDPYK